MVKPIKSALKERCNKVIDVCIWVQRLRAILEYLQIKMVW